MQCPKPKVSRAGFLQFLRDSVGIPTSALPDNSEYIDYALCEARTFVDNGMGLRQRPIVWVSTVYNMGASLLLNHAPDQPGQTFFSGWRAKLGLNTMPNAGVMNAAADQGTSGSLVVSKAMQNLSLADLMLLRDPYGRQVAAVLMEMGPLWGLTRGCPY